MYMYFIVVAQAPAAPMALEMYSFGKCFIFIINMSLFNFYESCNRGMNGLNDGLDTVNTM